MPVSNKLFKEPTSYFDLEDTQIMKKVGILIICLMLACIPLVTGVTIPKIQTPLFAPTGTYEGSIGYRTGGKNWTSIGAMNGTYTLRTKGGHFTGDWSVQAQNKSATGTMRGFFHPPFMFGRIAIDGGRNAPIVGFLVARNNSFGGRFMAPVGPALYFKGTYV
jgi:hypothetical protein